MVDISARLARQCQLLVPSRTIAFDTKYRTLLTPPLIVNAAARRLFLARHGLAKSPRARLTQTGLADIINGLGFVQLDSIQTVARAHHMILFARNQTYRSSQLDRLHAREAAVFENWTHDAALLPTAFYPYWMRVFERRRMRLHDRFRRYHGDAFWAKQQQVLAQIARNGPQMARDFDDEPDPASEKWGWNWHPSKAACEYLWRTGGLAVARREGFQKVYDLPERVIPDHGRLRPVSDAELVEWACSGALDRLGFASVRELAAFWDAVTPTEAAAWCRAQNVGGRLTEVAIASAGYGGAKRHMAFMRPETLASLDDTASLPGAVRLLSPFDPVVRDRRRAKALFGFDYRIEIFVPAQRRRYGYYVFPLLEGDRFVGRLDAKCDRNADALITSGLWLEPRLKLTAGRLARLEEALARLAAFAGVNGVWFADAWRRGC